MSQALPEPSARLGIGKVLDELRPDFPELTLSKLRYLEQEGLVEPERTASGYRKYSYADVERLRFVLRMQKERFWPLGHIRQVLDEIDRGVLPDLADDDVAWFVPEVTVSSADGMPTAATFSEGQGATRLSRDELLEAADIDAETLEAIEEFQLIRRRPQQRYYSRDDLLIASLVGKMATLGIEPRHLRGFRAAADREVSLLEQAVPSASRTNPNAAATLAELAATLVRLHTVLVRNELRGS
ncbi:MerR family transcriptional regulator [Aeromicrobium phragmitis]|uniref:MerR family transcriptional regulator n=1 Tax=Aeromicrobium phragmitis TaxID=2478914 RepID=A0A3L8PJZ4_9ACTN|nr:MerR family transcriptional regulator [Aeromicrobium phragmitis]RLV55550.1 MerR family transcriptional regulator [Aeromicrobium phragmitis]